MEMEVFGIALGGLERAQKQVEQTATRLARVDTTQPPADTVDLSAEMVSLIEARNTYEANLNVLKTADQMRGGTVNLLA